jgi:FAD/FMN-containing dehydrogenase
VRFGEHPEAVRWQLERLPAEDWERLDGEEERAAWDQVRGFYRGLGEIVVRVAASPSRLEELVRRFEPPAWLAHAASGILLMSVAEARIPELRREFPAILERAPLEVRRRVPTFGLAGREYELMRRFKDALDPGARLNPGRHVDGETSE